MPYWISTRDLKDLVASDHWSLLTTFFIEPFDDCQTRKDHQHRPSVQRKIFHHRQVNFPWHLLSLVRSVRLRCLSPFGSFCCCLACFTAKSPFYETKSSEEGQILRPLVVEVRCTRQSPPMRGRILRPLVVEVRCTRRRPPMRGRFLRPLVVKVRCTRQSPPTRGRF